MTGLPSASLAKRFMGGWQLLSLPAFVACWEGLNKFKLAPFVAVCTVLLTPVAPLAEEGATGVLKERMDLMEKQKDAMRVIGAMGKGGGALRFGQGQRCRSGNRDHGGRDRGSVP